MAVDAHKLDNFKPYIFKTSDFGKSWTKLSAGFRKMSTCTQCARIPDAKGLLYAGTETGVWVSFDDGAHWQSLQTNLPNTPIHDLVVHGNDLTAATHGRAFWVLDDLAPLRQMTAAIAGRGCASVRAFPPRRVRASDMSSPGVIRSARIRRMARCSTTR